MFHFLDEKKQQQKQQQQEKKKINNKHENNELNERNCFHEMFQWTIEMY